MKANSSWKVLEAVRAAGLWIDAVSGNEVLRARRAGFAMGARPPVVMLTADVLRDNALTVVLEHGVMPNVGSPGDDRRAARRRLRRADRGAREPGVRARPRAVVRHRRPVVEARHLARGAGRAARARRGRQAADRQAARAPRHRPRRSRSSTTTCAGSSSWSAARLADFPDVEAREPRAAASRIPIARARPLRPRRLSATAGRGGRAAGGGGAGGRSASRSNPAAIRVAGGGPARLPGQGHQADADQRQGAGAKFIMVDAGFNDLVRPAMYGSYHHISIVGQGRRAARPSRSSSRDRCARAATCSRATSTSCWIRARCRGPRSGDLLVLHDAGAYGAAMSSNYVSHRARAAGVLGRRPRHAGVAARDARRRRARRVFRAAAHLTVDQGEAAQTSAHDIDVSWLRAQRAAQRS